MTANELSLLVKGSAPHFILDIREIHEVENGSFGAFHSYSQWPFVYRVKLKFPRDIPVAVYCRSGARSSAIVSALMTKYGFNEFTQLDREASRRGPRTLIRNSKWDERSILVPLIS